MNDYDCQFNSGVECLEAKGSEECRTCGWNPKVAGKRSQQQIGELKKCPFCGYTAALSRTEEGYFFVICGGCGMNSAYFRTSRAAKAAWNRRRYASP